MAYKISQSPDDKGVDVNFISAQTFVAEYVSRNFKNRKELEDRISKSGEDMKGLNAFAETVYNFFINENK